MKIFAIKENNKTNDIGFLFYYEKAKEFYIELMDNLVDWDIPMLLSSLYKKGEKTIDAYWSKLWVSQRIVPSDRQNIGQILRDNKLKQYDEFELLLLAKGRCEQDDFYISRIKENELPKEIIERRVKRVQNIFLQKDKKLLVFFRNNDVKLCNLPSNDFTSVDILTDGYGVYLNNNVTISYTYLYDVGEKLPLEVDDFVNLIKEDIINTVEAMKILNCTRQYVNELVKKGVLHPIKSEDKNTLFLKNEVISLNWT